MNFMRKSAAFLLSAVMLCSGCLLGGCNKKGESSSNGELLGESVYSPFVPENPIDESVEGKTVSGSIGSAVQYDGKVSASLDKVMEFDLRSSDTARMMLAEMTITNNSDKKIDCSTGTHFGLIADGGDLDTYAVIDIGAAIAVRQYYNSLGVKKEQFNQEIQPGETVKGYVAFKAPGGYKELSIVYTPYKYYSNDRIALTVKADEVDHYEQAFNMVNKGE